MPDNLKQKAVQIADRLRSAARERTEAQLRDLTWDYLLNYTDYDEDDPEAQRLCQLIVAALRGAQVIHNDRKERKSLDEDDCTSPFRFAEIAPAPTPAPEPVQEACNDRPLPGGFSGVIEVEWAFETPMLIGAPEGEPGEGTVMPMKMGSMQNAPYVIPGATLRGMMRAAMEIVCRARLTQVNAHHVYGVRDFTHALFAEDSGDGASRLAWEDLQAGWLSKAGEHDPPKGENDSDYVITPCDKRMIRIRALPEDFNGGNSTNNGVWHRRWLSKKLPERYKRAGMTTDGKLIDFTKTSQFSADNEGYVYPDGDGQVKGVYVFSGHSPTAPKDDAPAEKLEKFERKLDKEDADEGKKTGRQKKREYVFIERNGAQAVRLKQDVFDRFELIHSKPSKNKRQPDGSYKDLWETLTAGQCIPIFFSGQLDGLQEDMQIGLTRLFKLRHQYSVGNKIPPRHKPDPRSPDFIEALYGYVFETDETGTAVISRGGQSRSTAPSEVARKGRIAFGFAKLQNPEDAHLSETITAVMTGPRASFGPFYLRGKFKDWSDEKAQLAGRKRYFPRFPARSQALAGAARTIKTALKETQPQRGNREMESHLKFLEPKQAGGELVFNGEIRLHNVLKEEIGALLWALTHGGDPAKPYRHMLGRAKNFGAGQARVKSVRLRLCGHDEGANASLEKAEPWEQPGHEGGEGWISPNSQSMQPFLQEFQTYMQTHCPGWPNVPDLREFLGISSPEEGAKIVEKGRAAYPSLEKFKDLRETTKLRSDLTPPSRSAPYRYLPAPMIDFARIRLPYLS